MKKTILFCLMITISVFGLYADGLTLQDGFSVEKGATFAVYPSSF